MKPVLALAFDLAFLVLATLIVGPPLAATAALVAALPIPAWLAWGLAPVWFTLFLVLLCGTLFVARLCIPKLQPGQHAFPGSTQAVGWLFHFGLQRIMNQPLWRPMVFSLAGLRWLMLRALGAKVAFGIQSAMDILLVDPSLVEVGPGSMLAAGTLLSGHVIESGQLLIAPVKLGANVQIMGQATLAPGVEIGENTVVGPGSKVLPSCKIGSDVFIGLGCILHEGVTIGSDAVIGHQCTLERGVAIGEGAVVRPFTHVPKGTVLADGAKYPPAEALRP
jgi:acetyltransferase-like isoleucine patch superfamily enzyme